MDEEHSNRLEALYRQAVDMGEQARSWFDGPGIAWRAGLSPDHQAQVAIEGLSTTARLLGVMSWLLDPAQSKDERCKPLCIADEGQALSPESPLSGTPGGEIAMATRRLASEVAVLATERVGSTPSAQQTSPEAVTVEPEGISMQDYAGLWRQ
jgi:hypothetical protein